MTMANGGWPDDTGMFELVPALDLLTDTFPRGGEVERFDDAEIEAFVQEWADDTMPGWDNEGGNL
jgi:hypothetical protein